MKKLIFLLLVPILVFTQESWIHIQLQTDQYPGETSWELYDISGAAIAVNEPFLLPEFLHDTVISIPAGEYIISLNDAYGDGLAGSFWGGNNGWFSISNACQDSLMYVEGAFYEDSLLTTEPSGPISLVDTLTIAPCAPPLQGCTDELAENFNEDALINDGSCTYIYGCINEFAFNYNPLAADIPTGIITPGSTCNLVSFTNTHFGVDPEFYLQYQDILQIGARIYVGDNGQQWFIDAVAFDGGGCNSPTTLIYVVSTQAEADGNPNTNTPGVNVNAVVGETWQVDPCIFIYGCTDPNALNYNEEAGIDDGSCINIPGCTDPEAASYNPAATTDDGSCNGGDITCTPGKTLVTVEIMVDQYGCETSWIIYDQYGDGTPLAEVNDNTTYCGVTVGTTVEYQTCIADNTNIMFWLQDSYGDGLGGAQWGGIDGTWAVYTECGDTISEGIGDFGELIIDVGQVTPCAPETVEGCTNNEYLEFNPYANEDDGSCETERIFGCINPDAFNFNPDANTQLSNPNCTNTLRLTDWADNGWAGSFLVVTQGDQWWGPFTLQSDQTVFETEINFNTSEMVKAYFYSFGQSQQTTEQCSFEIINPIGDIILEGGTNPYTNPILSYNQYNFLYQGQALCGNNCIPKIYGCLDLEAVNFDPIANTSSNDCYYNPGCTDAAYIEYYNYIEQNAIEADFDNGTCEVYAIFGCIDETAYNYNELATVNQVAVEDETDPCIPTIYGCTDPLAFNYDQEANTLEPGSCQPVINGCTDSAAFNYDEDANTDNDSCIEIVYGCTDDEAFNYYPDANVDDDSCEPVVEGCTQSNQFNYNELANTDDGSCYPFVYGCLNPNSYTYNDYDNDGVGNPITGINGVDVNTNNNYCVPFIYGCLDETAFNYNPEANTEDENNPCEAFVYGCMDPTMFNFNVNANTDDGSCIEFAYGCTDPEAYNYDETANTNVGCISFVYGCTNPDSFNYNPQANTTDNSCVDVVIGCTDDTALNYDQLANTNSGCVYPVLGCTDPTAFNFNVNANIDDDSCQPVVIGCTDDTALNYQITANTNSGCIYAIYGCTDPSAFNFNATANTNNGSCIDVVIGCTDSTALNYNELANTNNGCIYPILGCTNPEAFNYNADANTDDGSCEGVIIGCMDSTMFNYDSTANTDSGNCIPYVYGCMDSTAFNYDPLANTDNGTCIEFVYGCTDTMALNFDPLANTLDNSCCYVGGCTDSTALNYDEDACFNDGSCVVIIEGCADPNAYNYDPLVNLPDNSTCLYNAGCYGGPGEPYWLNDPCYAWVIDIDNYCCTELWDETCQSMYNYCEEGWPVNLDELSGSDIIVYPNPTANTFTIETRLDVDVELYNMIGEIIQTDNIKRIDLSDYPDGMYNLIITYDKIRITKKIIKL